MVRPFQSSDQHEITLAATHQTAVIASTQGDEFRSAVALLRQIARLAAGRPSRPRRGADLLLGTVRDVVARTAELDALHAAVRPKATHSKPEAQSPFVPIVTVDARTKHAAPDASSTAGASDSAGSTHADCDFIRTRSINLAFSGSRKQTWTLPSALQLEHFNSAALSRTCAKDQGLGRPVAVLRGEDEWEREA